MRRWLLFAVTTAGAASALYWLTAGMMSENAPFAFWHPGVAAFLGSTWFTVNTAVHCLLSFAKCERCDELIGQRNTLERQLAQANEALATLSLPESRP